MRQYVVQRLLGAIPVLFGVVTLVFLVMRILPGEPTAVLAAQSGSQASDVIRLRAEYGLDRPLWLQYVSYLSGLSRGNLGRSLFSQQEISQIIIQQAPATIVLAFSALAVAVGVGLPIGIVAAIEPAGWADRACMAFSVITVSIPIPLLGLLMILIFSLTLRWLPATGQGTPYHLAMPAAAMGLTSAGSIARLVRAQLIDILKEEYINVARAKGLPAHQVLFGHALRNALIPVITIVGLQFGFMLGGAVATETVFARSGLGRTLVDAILYQDYPVVQGIVIVSAALYTLINLAVDLAYGYLDPRIHHE
jgi:peptide/nickel transport system permease protein